MVEALSKAAAVTSTVRRRCQEPGGRSEPQVCEEKDTKNGKQSTETRFLPETFQ